METVGMRKDHAEFIKHLENYQRQFGEVRYCDSGLPIILFYLEKRIRDLEFKINEK